MAAALTSSINSPLPTQRLLGKVALVTGGAAGIGESIVRLLYKHGAKICLVDINDDVGQHLCNSFDDDSKLRFFHCDVSKEDDVKRAVDFTVEQFGTLDIMVNNAGFSDTPSIEIRNVNCNDIDKVIDINIKGVFYGMKHASRIMIPSKKGSIVSLCSAAAVVGGIASHAYTASKHAVIGLTKNVAAELGQHGVRVNCVSPYGVVTNMSLLFLPAEERSSSDGGSSSLQGLLNKVANLQGVELMANDVANAVVFLASDEARYISGHNLVVDGGFASVNHSLGTFK